MNQVKENDDVKNKQESIGASTTSVRVKTPKRILHFSDGTLEEYSDDDDDNDIVDGSKSNTNQPIDLKRLNWGPWLFHYAAHGGHCALSACEYVGEEIASFLGITTPKYSYEIKQYKRNQKERQKQAQEEKDVGGWMQQTQESLVNGSTSTVKNQQPSNVNAEQSERY